MRRILLSISALLFITISTTVNAQSSKIGLGIEGGAGVSNLNQVFDPELGFATLLFGEFNFNEKLSTHVGLGYDERNSSFDLFFDDSIYPIRTEIDYKYSFITMPILFKVKFGSKVKFFINAGPYINYLVKKTGYGNDLLTNTKDEVDLTSNTKRFEFGLSSGVGIIVPLVDKLSLSLELRNNFGFNNITTIEGADEKTNSTIALLGFTYQLGE